jgi:hypothetical protein
MIGRIAALIVLASSVASIPAFDAQPQLALTASSANVGEAGTPITIRILRWSTDEERTPLVAALTAPPPAATRAAPVASSAGVPAEADGGRPATVGRAGRGRGARGAAAPLSPVAALTAALGKAPTLGYVWTNGITGYSIKYALRLALPDGGQRIILATDRRLGAYAPAWTPTSQTITDYDFTLIEIRLNANGSGEGKTSLTTRVAVDAEAKTIALDDYNQAPVLLQHIARDAHGTRP